ncbi:MAG: AraC family transcriptional regulator [Lachnospiraceae bacterium]|nr:AraC family transcriptional regulator [Lachnospiraceae bacterium]
MKPDKIKQNEINSVKNNYINSVNLNINSDFPYLVLDVINDNAYPRNPGFQVMHWHEDLQFIYVIDGSIEVRTLDNAIQVNSGEAFFINKDVVHYVKRIGNCHYNSFLFPAYFLEFYIGSPVKAFVDSIITNEQLTLFHFTPSVQWHNVIINKLYQLSKLELSRLASRKLESTTLEKDKNIFYPYEVLVLLSSIWLIMIKNISIPTHQEQSLTNLRMQKILQFIEMHFSEDITLSDLAHSANISKSECSRCFKDSLDTTPYNYLIEFRLSKAARLLKDSHEPISNIAADVGFNQLSHFGKCFKDKTGYSPREYRKRMGK